MADTNSPPKPVEVGYLNGEGKDFYSSLWDPDTVPELRWPESIRTYNKMRKTDGQIATVLKAINLPIRATQWRIDPAGARPEVTEFIAEQLGLPIIGGEGQAAGTRRPGRFSFAEHLRHVLLMIPLGSMFFEQIVEPTPDGYWGIRKLAPRMPDTIEKINVARDGGLVSIEQRPPMDDNRRRARNDRIVIPVDRLVAYVWEREGAEWAGESLLRPAYPHWALKVPLLKIEASAVERNAMGVPVYKNPPGADNDAIEKGRKMAEGYRSGSQSGASLPYEADLKLLGVSGQLLDPRPVIEYHDAQIGRIALAHFLNLDGQGGSYSLASTQEDLFTTQENGIAAAIADTTTQHVVADLVDWNFGPDEPIPRITFDDIRSDSLAIANALRTLADAGLIRPDRSLEEWLRRDMGAPTKDTAPPEEPWDPDTAPPAPPEAGGESDGRPDPAS